VFSKEQENDSKSALGGDVKETTISISLKMFEKPNYIYIPLEITLQIIVKAFTN
jgi:hypothetical protein